MSLSPYDQYHLQEMQAAAWKAIGLAASVAHLTKDPKLKELNTLILLNQIEAEKKKIDKFIDNCKNFYENAPSNSKL